MATGQTVEDTELVYIVGLYTSLVSAYLVKNKLQRSTFTKDYQLYFIGLIGLWIYYSIWGKSVALPVLQVSISYLMMVKLRKEIFTKCIFIFAMSFLSLCHVHNVYLRLYFFETNQSSDFTGPLMIITQRIIALAFNVHDGLAKENLDETQKKYAVVRMPSFAEYFAYNFSFTGIMCGPFAFYNDVIPVLRGDYKQKSDEPSSPSSGKAVFVKATSSMVFIYIYWLGAKTFSCQLNIDQTFIDTTSLLYRLGYLYVSLFLARAKYYGAWLFADAVHNAMGIGFNGYEQDGQPKWDLVTNINIFSIEFATGLKTYIDNWNLMTVKWLRYVSYNRLNDSRYRKYASLLTFMLSAFWHGFFPGYYIMFLTCHISLLVQRKARRAIRPYFQSSPLKRAFYAIITCALTQLAIAYAALAFVVLEWNGSIRFYQSVWFVGHVVCVSLYLLLPSTSRKPKETFVTSSTMKSSATTVTSELEDNFTNSLSNGQSHLRRR